MITRLYQFTPLLWRVQNSNQGGFFTNHTARFAWSSTPVSCCGAECVPWCPQACPVPGSPAGLRSLAGPVLQRGAPAEPRAVHLPGVHGAGGHHPPHQLQGTASPEGWGLLSAQLGQAGSWGCIPEPQEVPNSIGGQANMSKSNFKGF